MDIRLLGAALATTWLLSVPATALAQTHGDGHHGGGGGQQGGGAQQGGGGQQSGGGREHADGSRVAPSGPSFSQPYYTFQPQLPVNFGLFIGFPVPFPSASFYPSGYPYTASGYVPHIPVYPFSPISPYVPNSPYSPHSPFSPYLTMPSYPRAPAMPTYPYGSLLPTYGTYIPVYGYSNSTPVTEMTVEPSTPSGGTPPPTATGGVSFEITPGDAAVFVDGVYVGTANNFSPTAPPLLLAAGRHHFELRAQGSQPMAFDVDVPEGQVIPYRGTLQP
jgi:hypothetical protein